MTNECNIHEHKALDLVDRVQRFKPYGCPWCEIEQLRWRMAGALAYLSDHCACAPEIEKDSEERFCTFCLVRGELVTPPE